MNSRGMVFHGGVFQAFDVRTVDVQQFPVDENVPDSKSSEPGAGEGRRHGFPKRRFMTLEPDRADAGFFLPFQDQHGRFWFGHLAAKRFNRHPGLITTVIRKTQPDDTTGVTPLNLAASSSPLRVMTRCFVSTGPEQDRRKEGQRQRCRCQLTTSEPSPGAGMNSRKSA